VRPNSDSSNRRRIVRRHHQPKGSARNKIEDRRAALNDAPRLDAVQITGVYGKNQQIGRPDRGLTVISGGTKQLGVLKKGWVVKTTLRDVSHFTVLGLLLVALTSCGGGGAGGSMSTNASAPQPPQSQILESVPAPQEPFDIPSTTLTASSGAKSYTAIYSETPNNGTTMFDGQEANSSTISLTVNENGAPIATEIDTAYYLENPYQPLGMSISANGGQFDFLYNSTDPLPSTLTAGNSGPLGSGTYYVVNTNDGIGSLTETYSVAAWNNSSTLLLTTYATGTLNGQMVNETITYVLNGGPPILSSVEVIVNGTQLTFMSACNGCWDY
jgi:hypothetical protein